MTTLLRYQVDRARIIFEQFEDETVLVNTETGYYYSLSNTGSEVLRLLDEGCAVDELSQILFGTAGDACQLRSVIENFVAQLANESIITVRAAEAPCCKYCENQHKAIYSSVSDFPHPKLERFDDVRELLLIDPVHQVDQEYGWPKAQVQEVTRGD